MLVVSDTTPINYLVLIGLQEILGKLYTSVVIPTQVLEELQRDKAPSVVRTWTDSLPSWALVQPGDPNRYPNLNYGEAAALSLAVDLEADLLADDAKARAAAIDRGVMVTGTLGILAEAHLASLIDFEDAIQALDRTTFQIHRTVVDRVRQRIRSLEKESDNPGSQH